MTFADYRMKFDSLFSSAIRETGFPDSSAMRWQMNRETYNMMVAALIAENFPVIKDDKKLDRRYANIPIEDVPSMPLGVIRLAFVVEA